MGADDWLPFEETVARFSLAKYLDQVAGADADYVIFTVGHALQMLLAPCAVIGRVLPGRTSKRDLIGELADACHARGMCFILYYNHSCNNGDDPEWNMRQRISPRKVEDDEQFWGAWQILDQLDREKRE